MLSHCIILRLKAILCSIYLFSIASKAQIDTALLNAIKNNDLPAVEKYSHDNEQINCRDENGANALNFAVYYSNLEIVKCLINHSAKIEDSAVIYTSNKGKGYVGSLQVAAIQAGRLNVLEYLIDSLGLSLEEKEFNPYSRTKEGTSIFNYAVDRGSADIVKFLLQRGAKVDVVDNETSTPIVTAFESEHWDIFSLLAATDVYKKRVKEKVVFFENAVDKLKARFAIETAHRLEVRMFSLELRRILFGDSSLGFAAGLKGLATDYNDNGSYDQAQVLFQQALGIIRVRTAEYNLVYPETLTGLAFTCFNMAKYDTAISLLQDALSIIRTRYGEESPYFANNSPFLALAYVRLGQYDKAFNIYPRILSTMLKTQGEENGPYTMTLNHLAFLYSSIGQYKEATKVYEQAIAISKKINGNSGRMYGGNLIDLGYAYFRMGQYNDALPLFEEAAQIMQKSVGEKHQYYALAINGLALIYEQTGNYNKAFSLYTQVRETIKQGLGEDHPLYAYSLNNLAAMHMNRKDYNKALPLYIQAVNIRKKTLKEDHPDYAQSLNNLAVVYEKKTQYDIAMVLYKQALAITKKAVGEQHRYYADCLSNMAALYMKKDKFDSALNLYMEALEIRKQVLGERHPHYARNLNDMGILYSNINQFDKASSCFIMAEKIILSYLSTTYSTLSEQEKMSFSDQEADQFNYLPSIIFKQRNNAKALTVQLYQNEIVLKGIVLQNQQQILSNLRASGDTISLGYYEKWRFNKSFLGRQLLLPMNERVKYFDSVEEKTNYFEQILSRRAERFSHQYTPVLVKDISKRLLKGQAAIEFIRFRLYNHTWTDSVIYAALILLPGDTAPAFIPLFEERKLLQLLRASASSQGLATIQKLYPGVHRSNSNALYNLIWKPMEHHLKNAKVIYYAPVGLLHRIAFDALQSTTSELLIDRYQLNQVLSTRIVANAAPINRIPTTAAIWGNCNYENTNRTPNSSFLSPDVVNLSKTKQTSAGWPSLPETRREVDALKMLLSTSGVRVNAITGSSANEKAFKLQDGKSPYLLHIATHGFFLPEQLHIAITEKSAINMFANQPNPMLRSGLVLAGGNQAWRGELPAENGEDGILTAYEIAQMDFSNTDLVVLSACETALGDISGTEGVIGLQRAFKIAGIKQMIISLWQVPDKATRELMLLFYKKWLGGLSPREALRKAQLKLKEKYPPYFWAAFKLVE